MSPNCRPRASVARLLALVSLTSVVSLASPASVPAQTGAPTGRWVSLGPTKILKGGSAVSNGDVTGRVTTIAVDWNHPEIIFVGARGSGVWRTLDGGFKWQPVTDALPTQTVVALATSPSQPKRVYLDTPAGTFRSDDNGDNWNHVSTVNLRGRGWDNGAMIVDPLDADRVFLTTCSGGTASPSIQRTRDGGVTWEAVLSVGCATGIERAPGWLDRYLVAISNGGATAGLWETLDGGDTWTRRPGCLKAPLPTPTPETMVRIAVSGNVRFASFRQSNSEYRLFRSDGKTCGDGANADFMWQPAWVAPPAWVDGELWSGLHVNPDDASRVAATGKALFLSTDGGFTFSIPGQQPHVDHHAWVYDPLDASTVLAGTDGGFYRSTDDGLAGSWSFRGEGIVNAELYDLADSGTSPRVLFAGSQDNGAFEYLGSGTLWRWKTLGDAEMVEIDPTDDDVRYTLFQSQHELWVTTDNYATATFYVGTGIPTGCGTWSGEYPADPLGQFLIHPAQPSTLLMTCKPLSIGWPFNPLFDPSPDSTATVAVDPSVNLYWSGTARGQVHAGPSGLGWRLLFSHPSNAASVALQVDPAEPTVLFAAFRPWPQTSGRVYRIERFDDAPKSVLAIDITSNLPAGVRMKSLAVDRLQPQTIYAGTDFGVYRGHSEDAGATWTWTSYKDGLPEAVDVRALEVHAVTGVMRAGTFGRGVYEVQTDSPIGESATVEGLVTMLSVQDGRRSYGPPGDTIDADVIVQLDTMPGYAFGFQSGDDTGGMLDRLRDAVRANSRVRLDYLRTGFRNGVLQEVWNLR